MLNRELQQVDKARRRLGVSFARNESEIIEAQRLRVRSALRAPTRRLDLRYSQHFLAKAA